MNPLLKQLEKAAGHNVKNTVTAPECAELLKMTDSEKNKIKNKVLVEKYIWVW